jgi:hypothetical protein
MFAMRSSRSARRGRGVVCARVACAPPWLALVVLLAAPGVARAQTGNVCVQDFLPGAVCTANDVRIQALNLVSIVETCAAGVPGEAEAVFDVFISASGSPERYDIGTFLALDGGSALSGDACFHDYLQPPLTPTPTFGDKNMDGIADVDGGPWLDADADQCGDISAGTQLFKMTPSIRVACVDTNNNGIVDASVCTSWDNNTGSVCSSLADAFPGTAAKCGCARVELGIPFTGPSPSPSPSPVPALPLHLLIALAMLLAATGYLLLRRGRGAPPTA